MQNTLRSLILASVALAAVAFTANSAMAASTVNVPFSFKVDGKVWPAGHYMIKADDLANSVELQGKSQGFKCVIHPGDAGPNDQRVILKFDRVGSEHILRSMQYGSLTTSQLDKKPKQPETATEELNLGQ